MTGNITHGASEDLLPFLEGRTDMGPIEAAAAVCSSFAGRDGTNVDAIVDLFGKIYAAVLGSHVATIETPLDEPLVPAISIRKSVQPDFIVCLEDGKKFKSLKRHLSSHYNLTPDEYRTKWGLPADYPMVAPNYSATRSKLAKDNGLGTKR